MTDHSAARRLGWKTRRRMYGATGVADKALSAADKQYLKLLDRWLYKHDIRAIGTRAVEETA